MRHLEGLPLSEAEKCEYNYNAMKETLIRKFEIRESEIWMELRALHQEDKKLRAYCLAFNDMVSMFPEIVQRTETKKIK